MLIIILITINLQIIISSSLIKNNLSIIIQKYTIKIISML